MLEVLGRIGLGVCLCGYAAIVLWVWGWDKRKDRRERRHGESSDKTGAVQQSNVSGAESGAGERSRADGVMREEMMLAEIEGGDAKKIARDAFIKETDLEEQPNCLSRRNLSTMRDMQRQRSANITNFLHVDTTR